MNKNIKAFGSGFMNGVKHPFTDYTPGRYSGKDTMETVCDILGESVSQGIIQTAIGFGICFGIFWGMGYLNSRINKNQLKVKMVVDKTPNKK